MSLICFSCPHLLHQHTEPDAFGSARRQTLHPKYSDGRCRSKWAERSEDGEEVTAFRIIQTSILRNRTRFDRIFRFRL